MSKIKKKFVVIASILLTAMMLAAPVAAQTSQNLDWGIDVEDTFYFNLHYDADPILINEGVRANVTGPISAIPDPLTDWADIPDTLTEFQYLNGTDIGMMIMFVMFALKVAVPIGNWSLLTTLVEAVTTVIILETPFDISPNVTIDTWLHWGFTYNMTQPGYCNVVTVKYLKSDGFMASMSVYGYETATQTLMGVIEMDRDGTAPVISSPSDIAYNVSDIGNEISWSATDQSPAGYILYKDDVELKRGMWNSSLENIVVDIDDLAVGSYDYEIEFYEASGMSASDVVTVTVSELTNTTTSDTGTDTGTGTGDFISNNLILIIGVGGGVVVLIVIVIIIKKR